MSKISFVQLYTEDKAKLLPGILREFEALAQSGQYILGAAVTQFEDRFAELCGTKFAIGVNSGLDALILSLRALKIGPGDEVIVPPNSFLASAAAVELVGARTVFADVADDYNISPLEIERRITPKTKAIMVVHLTGNPCDMDPIRSLADAHGLFILEDAAQAVGATYHGKKVGALGDVGCFSLHPLKNLHVWGDGGMITTSNAELAHQLRLQRNHGLKNRDEAEFFSYNSRLDTFQALVGNAFLELLPATQRARQENARFYYSALADLDGKKLVLLKTKPNTEAVFHVFQLWTEKRDALKSFLDARGIETKVHYPVPIHLQAAAKHLGYGPGDFPVTERLAAGILSLPVRENLMPAERERVAAAVREFFGV